MDFEAIIGRECPTPIKWNTERRYIVGRVTDEVTKRDARITALEQTERELREAVRVLAVTAIGAENARQRLRECQKSMGGACGQTVQEVFARMRYHNVPEAIFESFNEALNEAFNNPIAAAAVREAGR